MLSMDALVFKGPSDMGLTDAIHMCVSACHSEILLTKLFGSVRHHQQHHHHHHHRQTNTHKHTPELDRNNQNTN